MRAMKRTTRAAMAALLVVVASFAPGVALAQSSSDLGPLTTGPWLLTQLGGTAVAADAGITAVFSADGHLSGSAGCNDYNATYTFDESGSMTVGPLSTTRKACADAVMSLENGYLVALQGTSEWAISGGVLTLTGTGGTVLTYSGAQGIQGSWTLLSIGGEQVPNDITVTADFAADGTLTGSGGCNGYSSTYIVEGTSLTIAEPSVTRKACELTISGIEALYLDTLRTASTFSVTNGQLTISTTSGPGDLVFAAGGTAAPPSGAPLPSGGPVAGPAASGIVGTWQVTSIGGLTDPAGTDQRQRDLCRGWHDDRRRRLQRLHRHLHLCRHEADSRADPERTEDMHTDRPGDGRDHIPDASLHRQRHRVRRQSSPSAVR